MMRFGISLQLAYFIIFTALIALMAATTCYGLWAEGRASNEQAAARLAVVNSRTRMGWWLIFVFAAAWWFGLATLSVIFAIFSFFLLREFIALTPIKTTDHWVLVLAFYLAIPAQYVLVYFDWDLVFTLFIPVYMFLVLPVIAALSHDTDRYLERVAKVQWGLMVCVFCVSHAPAVFTIGAQRYGSTGPLLLLFFLLVLFCSDLFSVIASYALGGRGLAFSSHKTARGLLVGGLAGIAVGVALFWLTPFRVWQAAAYSLAIVLSGTMGDVVMSAIKRSLGSRDWAGEMYIGRGTLERLAPLTFAAPVFYHLVQLFVRLHQ